MYSTTFPGSIVDINCIFLDHKTPEPHRATSIYVYGHKYVSVVLIIEELTFFSNRIVNLWNNLPSSTTDFNSFRKFVKSVSDDYLLLYCKLNFAQFVNCFFRRMIFFIYCTHCLGQ